MSNMVTDDAWTMANQRLMSAELSRIAQRLGGAEDVSGDVDRLPTLRAAMSEPPAIDRVTARFALTPFERDVLLLCAGVEMEPRVAARCAQLSGDVRRAVPTFSLALAALAEPHWSAITPVRPLRRWRLVDLDESQGVVESRLRIDERILHYLAGVNYLDRRLHSLVCAAPSAGPPTDVRRDLCDAILAGLRPAGGENAPLIVLVGDDEMGQSDVATTIARELGFTLYVIHAGDIPPGHAELDAFVTLWERETQLLGSALLIDCHAERVTRGAITLAKELQSLAFIASAHAARLDVPAMQMIVNKPNAAEQARLWRDALGANALRVNGTIEGVARQFKLSARSIRAQSARLAPVLATSDRPDRAMWAACRGLGRSRLDELAQRVEASAGWHDLVLPDAQGATLRDIAAQVRNRLTVYDQWGFAKAGPRGLGISALFAGESGTGKTMAAEVMARELELDLYRIDLSSVVSKYIGETEKNLRHVFDAAEESGAILLFDEADALFGKRSEVKDSHDRYANIEVSYLLQRMEAYRGLAILTSNLRASLDTAFQRRLRFVVQFPFPDIVLREAIWRRVFPESAPLGDIDFRKLAKLNVAGGSIRNIALNAAFTAADSRGAITMADLLRAAHHDASKRERPLTDAETREWA